MSIQSDVPVTWSLDPTQTWGQTMAVGRNGMGIWKWDYAKLHGGNLEFDAWTRMRSECGHDDDPAEITSVPNTLTTKLGSVPEYARQSTCLSRNVLRPVKLRHSMLHVYLQKQAGAKFSHLQLDII